MAEAVKSGKVAKYISDFADDDLLGVENIICLPHLGASTPEAEDNCAAMAAREMTDYIENGIIVNSVNYPRLTLGRAAGKARVCVLYKADTDAAAKAAAVLGSKAVQSASAVKGNYGYAIMDADASDADKAAIEAVDGVIKVRII